MATSGRGGLSPRGRKHRAVAVVFTAIAVATWSLIGLTLARG